MLARAKKTAGHWPLSVHIDFPKWLATMANHTCTDDYATIPAPEQFADILGSLHELRGFPHTATYLVVSLDGNRHKQFIIATQLNQMANQIMKWFAAWPAHKKKYF